MKFEELLLYRDLEHMDIVRDISLFCEEGEKSPALASSVVSRMINVAAEYGFSGNVWHCFLSLLLVDNKNSFSLAAEKRGEVQGTVYQAALHDARILRDMFSWNFTALGKKIARDCFKMLENYVPALDDGVIFNRRIRDRIVDLSEKLSEASDETAFLKCMTDFYRDFGVGTFGLHKAFRVHHTIDDKVEIEPIARVKHVKLSDIVGMESQKQKLIENTEAFLAGRPANNVLLFGDAGTGKSSCIKGILNQYFDDGLRVIEVYKHQFKDLNEVISQVKSRNYKFIIYMDDLSFEDTETEYKYLKAVIEGGLEKKPDNILIYATSNRRHLVHENFSDKLDRRENDDIHESDTVQEKLSLSARFGVTIYFGRPMKKEFDIIVKTLAERNGIKMSEEQLLLEANRWELSHGGMSGRTAEQFIDYLLGTRLPDQA